MIKDTIYTIPISDVFDPKCGCPICNMRDMLEKRCVEYVMGAAMMEPDIRLETNKYGFCSMHFGMLSKEKNRLSLALMLETHLDELKKKHMPYTEKKNSHSPSKSCFVCKEISEAMGKMLNTIAKLYISDKTFKQLFHEQPFFCFPHYELLCTTAGQALNRKQAAEFIAGLTKVTEDYLNNLRNDIHSFTTMFDYRSAGLSEQGENVTSSLERGIAFLTSREKE